MESISRKPGVRAASVRSSAGRAGLILCVLGLGACGESSTAPQTECRTTDNPVPTGTLSRTTDGFQFTASDGWRITVTPTVITLLGPQHPDRVELWGSVASGGLIGRHENHNGKHVKDRFDARRSILLPSGALLTTVSGGVVDPMLTISIYEEGQSHTIDARTLTLTHSCAGSVATAVALDEAEADGEAATIRYKPDGGTAFTNEYNQGVSSSGAPLEKVYQEQPLSETGGPGNPTPIRDFVDDPRYGHT